MNSKEPDARIRIDKMLIEAGWKLPGWSKDEEINVKTEIKNDFGEADYVLLSSKENHLCTVEAKKTTLSPLVGKEQARDYADALKSRFAYIEVDIPKKGFSNKSMIGKNSIPILANNILISFF